LPFALAGLAMWLGGFLGSAYRIYAFFGEATWALYTVMVFYLGFALICNVALWVTFVYMKSKRAQT
jgi:hypothetical protein